MPRCGRRGRRGRYASFLTGRVCRPGRLGRHGRHRRGRSRSPGMSCSPGGGPRGNFLTLFGGLNLGGYRRYGGNCRVFDYGHLSDSDTDEGSPTPVPTRPRPQPKPEPEDQGVLQVQDIDLLISSNVTRHRTDQYDVTEDRVNPRLVVRRGQPFDIQLRFNRKYDTATDDLRLVFQIGDDPKPSKGTHVEFVLSDIDEAGQWGAKVSKQQGDKLDVTVFTPPDCCVGGWKLKVDVVKRKDNKTVVFRYNHKDRVIVLFNPWCKEDSVYMDNEKHREAYVLEDKGRIYCGNAKKISSRAWVFGQFSGKVLECVLYLLDTSGVKPAVRGNVIPIVRKLTALVNSQDEDGVLTGNWSGNYSGGTSPLDWTGSTAILEQYYHQKYPVRFGQCWVFSGVMTTVCRALGIPARSVTNFASAHDCDCSITIDMHFDNNGDSLEEENSDSVWNFHVWNEAWMARPDLPAGYGGWQACDATPQETSDGVYCCGPCPVRAIKEGEVNLPFDGPFVFAEVNADRVYWQEQADGSTKPVHIEKNSVGKFISTLAITGEREDVTRQYKFAEDSPEERVAVRRANQLGSTRSDVYQNTPKDVEFSLVHDAENQWVGGDFEVKLVCQNNSKEKRCLFGRLSARTMFNTGVVAKEVGVQPLDAISIKAGERKEVLLSVPPTLYVNQLKDGCMFSVCVMANVSETKQVFATNDDFRLRKPHLQLKAPERARVGEEFAMQVTFVNPLPNTLTNCSLSVDGPGITKPQVHPYNRDVAAQGTFSMTLHFKPAKPGKREIVAVFSSTQLQDINGNVTIDVSK